MLVAYFVAGFVTGAIMGYVSLETVVWWLLFYSIAQSYPFRRVERTLRLRRARLRRRRESERARKAMYDQFVPR